MVINALAIGYLLATTVWIWLDAVAAPWICRLSSSSSSSSRVRRSSVVGGEMAEERYDDKQAKLAGKAPRRDHDDSTRRFACR